MSDINQKAKEFFKIHSEAKEVFATKDKFLFLKKADALNHAKTLNADSPSVETIKNKGDQEPEPKKENSDKGLSPAEKKALKEKTIQEYTELFGEVPDEKLSAAKIQELIDSKKEALSKESSNENN